jgi:small redox-active disulfide protein 2
MGLFGKKETKKEAAKACGCESCDHESMGVKNIKVLGGGCAKCQALEASAKEALQELGIDAAIDHVTDFSEIASYGVMSTPALVIDGEVVSCGKVLKAEEIIPLLKKQKKH